jgi:hypothetical protein
MVFKIMDGWPSKNASSQPRHIKNHWIISSWCFKALVSSWHKGS